MGFVLRARLLLALWGVCVSSALYSGASEVYMREYLFSLANSSARRRLRLQRALWERARPRCGAPQAAPHRGQARSHSMDGGAALPAHAWPRARTARGEIADRTSGLARGAPEFGAVVARRHGRRGPQQIGAAGVCRQGVGYF